MKKVICILMFIAILFYPFFFSAQASAEPVSSLGKVLLIQTNLPWQSTSNGKMLSELLASGVISGYGHCTVDSFNSGIDIGKYQVIMFANDQTTSSYQRYEYISDELEFFARSGGVVVFGACDRGWGGNGYLSGKLPGGVTKNDLYQPRNYIFDGSHPIVTGVLTDNISLTDSDLTGNYCSHVSFSEPSIPSGYNVILRGRTDSLPTLVEYPLGKGKVIASGLTWEYYYPGGPGYPTDAGPIHMGAYFSAKAFKDLVVYALTQSKLNSTSDDVLKVAVVANERDGDTKILEGADVYLYVDGIQRKHESTKNGIAELDLSDLSFRDKYKATISATYRVAEGRSIDLDPDTNTPNDTIRDALFNNFRRGDNNQPIRYTYELHSETINNNGQWEGRYLRTIDSDEITLPVIEPRILYNISLAYLADDKVSQSDEYYEKVKNTIEYAAKYLAQATDGHAMLNDVIILKASSLTEFYVQQDLEPFEIPMAAMADIRIETKIKEDGTRLNAKIRSNASPNGFYSDTRSEIGEAYIKRHFINFKHGDLINNGFDTFPRIQLSGTDHNWYKLGTERYAEMVVHEFGHYLFGFNDEYRASDGHVWWSWWGARAKDKDMSEIRRPDGVKNFGLMDNQHKSIELSKRSTSYSYLNNDFSDDSKQSLHSVVYRESTEDTLARMMQILPDPNDHPYNNIDAIAEDIPDFLIELGALEMNYEISYNRARDHDRTASYPYASEILNIRPLDGTPQSLAAASAYGIEQLEEDEEYNAHFYLSDSESVIGYVRSDEIFDANFAVVDDDFVNGEYSAVSEATSIAVDEGTPGVTGEFYSVVSLLAEDVDYTTIAWHYYADGTFTELPTDLSLEPESINIGARCDYVGDGIYVLMAKGAAGAFASPVIDLDYVKSIVRDGQVILGFNDTTDKDDLAFYELVYSEYPFDSKYDDYVNRSVYFPDDDGEYYLNLYEPNRVAYVGVIVQGIHGEVSPLSEIIQVIGGEADRDGDGIPDWWCDKYHLWDKDGTKDIANSDDNDDGITNLEHYINGTDPTDPYNLETQDLYGDVNQDGVLNSVDSSIILLYLVGKTQLNARQLNLADINRDGKVNSADAAQILFTADNITPSNDSYSRVTLKVASMPALAGDFIDIPITISANSKCYALDFEIDYDSDFLQYDTAQRFGLFELEQLSSPQKGKVKIAFASDTALVDGGNVALLTFKVLKTCDPATELKIVNNHLFGFNSNLNAIEIPNMPVNGWIGTIDNIVPVEKVTLDKRDISILVGGTAKLLATVFPENATNKNVMWQSSDENIATVQDGIVTGIKVGTAIITVETYDGDHVANATVTVSNGSSSNNNKITDNKGDGQPSSTVSEQTEIREGDTPLDKKPWPVFNDISEDDWFWDDVKYVYMDGLMNGTGTTPMLFSPNMLLTRGEIVTILYRLEDNPDVAELPNPFSDVAAAKYYTDAVKWAAANGIVKGYGNGKFGPDDNIMREQLAAILMRYMKYADVNLPVTMQYIMFADEGQISDYAKDAIQTLNKLGIMQGVGDNKINPKGSATRAQVAAMLHRLLMKIK